MLTRILREVAGVWTRVGGDPVSEGRSRVNKSRAGKIRGDMCVRLLGKEARLERRLRFLGKVVESSSLELLLKQPSVCCAEMGKVGGGGTNRNMIFEAKILSRAEKAESCNGSWGGKPRTNSLMSRKFMNGGLR